MPPCSARNAAIPPLRPLARVWLGLTAALGSSLAASLAGAAPAGPWTQAALAAPGGLDPLWLVLGLAGAAAWLWDTGLEHPRQAHLWRLIVTSHNKLKVMLEAMNDPVFSLTQDGRVESLNLPAARLAGRDPSDLVGLGLADFLAACGATAETSQELRALVQRFFQEPPEEPSSPAPAIRCQLAGESWEISLYPVADEQEELVLTMAHARPSAPAAPPAPDPAAPDLAAAEAARELERQLTSMVIHDLKGPVGEILGNLDLLGFEPLSETQEEARQLAMAGAEDLFRMIQNLLDLNRQEEGRLRFRPEPLSFGVLADEVLGKFSAMLRLKGLEATVEDATSGELRADPELLFRVLQNLVLNAINHTEEEDGRLVLAGREDPQGGGVLLSLTDNGPGIPPEELERIFDKFSATAKGQAARHSTGLGLTFCKMVAEAHGGRIWAENTPEGGAAFFIWLPRG
ncbi:MAG: PAS domain-containing sensor histidine kinase [Deltaproteobacteria bacterium]|nr:PAS domain-containing sensor histidine kinase [Deltaproteobacteria bacterium]